LKRYRQLASGHLIPAYAISKPTAVISDLRSYLGSAAGLADIRETAYEIIVGFVIGVGIGAVLGLVLGSFRLAGQVLEPLVAAINGIPKIALAPLFLLFFGIGAWSKIAIAALGGCPSSCSTTSTSACGCASGNSSRWCR
jgi:NitT/TauT family transport system permease protein